MRGRGAVVVCALLAACGDSEPCLTMAAGFELDLGVDDAVDPGVLRSLVVMIANGGERWRRSYDLDGELLDRASSIAVTLDSAPAERFTLEVSVFGISARGDVVAEASGRFNASPNACNRWALDLAAPRADRDAGTLVDLAPDASEASTCAQTTPDAGTRPTCTAPPPPDAGPLPGATPAMRDAGAPQAGMQGTGQATGSGNPQDAGAATAPRDADPPRADANAPPPPAADAGMPPPRADAATPPPAPDAGAPPRPDAAAPPPDAGAPPPPPPPPVCADTADPSTLALYTFDEDPAPEVLRDETGAHPGRLVGSRALRPQSRATCGAAIGFPSNDRVEAYGLIPASGAWTLATGSFDVWVRVPQLPARRMMGVVAHDGDASGGDDEEEVGGRIQLLIACDGTAVVKLDTGPRTFYRCSNAPLTSGAWSHLVVNFGAPDLELIADGARATRTGPVALLEDDCRAAVTCGEPTAAGLDANPYPWLLGAAMRGNNRENPLRNGAVDSFRISRARR